MRQGDPTQYRCGFCFSATRRFSCTASQPRRSFRNLSANPHVALALDVTDIGRDVIRIEGTAVKAPDHPPADQVPAYAAKYTERIGAIFGTVERFAEAFSEAIIITPTRLHA